MARSFHAEIDDLEAKVKRATLSDQPEVEKLPPLNYGQQRQKSRIPVPVKVRDKKSIARKYVVNRR